MRQILLVLSLALASASVGAQERPDDWPIYRSEKFGIEFEYPPEGWKLAAGSLELRLSPLSSDSWKGGQPPPPHPWFIVSQAAVDECHGLKLGDPIFLRAKYFDEAYACLPRLDVLGGYWLSDPLRARHKAELNRMLKSVKAIVSR